MIRQDKKVRVIFRLGGMLTLHTTVHTPQGDDVMWCLPHSASHTAGGSLVLIYCCCSRWFETSPRSPCLQPLCYKHYAQANRTCLLGSPFFLCYCSCQKIETACFTKKVEILYLLNLIYLSFPSSFLTQRIKNPSFC